MSSLIRKIVVRLLCGLVIVQVLASLTLNWLMFYPNKNGYDAEFPGYVNIGTAGETIAAIVLGPRKGEKAIIYCHGNAEDATAVCRFEGYLGARCTIVTVDYPGYGLSSGKPTEAGCYAVVHRLYDWLRTERGFAPEDIFVIGYSIGSGPATELAATEPVGGLILEAPFLSAPKVVTRMRLLIANPFPNEARIG